MHLLLLTRAVVPQDMPLIVTVYSVLVMLYVPLDHFAGVFIFHGSERARVTRLDAGIRGRGAVEQDAVPDTGRNGEREKG